MSYVQLPAVSTPVLMMDCLLTVKHSFAGIVSFTTVTQAVPDSRLPVTWSVYTVLFIRCRTAPFAAKVLHATVFSSAPGATVAVNIAVAELPAPIGVLPKYQPRFLSSAAMPATHEPNVPQPLVNIGAGAPTGVKMLTLEKLVAFL